MSGANLSRSLSTSFNTTAAIPTIANAGTLRFRNGKAKQDVLDRGIANTFYVVMPESSKKSIEGYTDGEHAKGVPQIGIPDVVKDTFRTNGGLL